MIKFTAEKGSGFFYFWPKFFSRVFLRGFDVLMGFGLLYYYKMCLLVGFLPHCNFL